MRKRFLSEIVILLTLTILTSSCERKLVGFGDDAEIRILADSTVWLATEPVLRDIFEKPLITPQDETIFTILQGEIDNFKRFKNLILIGTLDSDDLISSVVKSNLSSAVLEKVEQGAYVFVKEEQWATNQMIMFLISTNIDSLVQKMNANSDYLFSIFDEYWNKTNKEQMYSFKRQTDVENHLLEDYGWKIDVQYDYEIFIEQAEKQFIMLRRSLPERWLFVHWIDTIDPSVIDQDWCIAKRNELGQRFYEGDSVETKFVQPIFEEVNFHDRFALKMNGIWKNDKKQAGGPFINYCFYDEDQRRIYMIDYAIFSPRLEIQKRNLLRQADIMLQTFKTADDLNKK
ncbi:DUF4837 family protein [candidate division KSB1 bacterium]|nr:DUF4837 family protein [candidate division KSB1 bacterium]